MTERLLTAAELADPLARVGPRDLRVAEGLRDERRSPMAGRAIGVPDPLPLRGRWVVGPAPCRRPVLSRRDRRRLDRPERHDRATLLGVDVEDDIFGAVARDCPALDGQLLREAVFPLTIGITKDDAIGRRGFLRSHGRQSDVTQSFRYDHRSRRERHTAVRLDDGRSLSRRRGRPAAPWRLRDEECGSEWLDSQVDGVEALRRGDVAALRRRDMPSSPRSPRSSRRSTSPNPPPSPRSSFACATRSGGRGSTGRPAGATCESTASTRLR